MMDHIKEIKEMVAEEAYEQLKHNREHVDTKELGEVIDMIKDAAEAAYYCSVVEAMEKAEKDEQQMRYYYVPYPKYPYGMEDGYDDRRRYATTDRTNDGRYAADRDNDGRYNENRSYADDTRSNNSNMNSGNTGTGGRNYADYRDPKYHIPYYDYNEPVMRDMREGRSPMTRRMYMEAKEQHQGREVQLQELEKYMGELGQDVTEMIADATPEEKQMLHNKLSALTNKIDLLMKAPSSV